MILSRTTNPIVVNLLLTFIACFLLIKKPFLQVPNQVENKTIALTGYFTEIPTYNKKLSYCGELAYAGVLEYFVTASTCEEMVGRKVLVILKCRSIHQKKCQYRMLVSEEDEDANLYLVFHGFERGKRPLYWVQQITRTNKKRKTRLKPKKKNTTPI